MIKLTIKQKLYSLAFLIGGSFILLNLLLFQNIDLVNKTWVKNYSTEISFKKSNKESELSIGSSLNKIYTLALINIVVLILLFLFLGYFFDKTIVQPIKTLEKGLRDFYNYLSDGNEKFNPIKLENKHDEFGKMAKITNDNFILITQLHDDINQQNKNLTELINHFDENVIASRTDIKGKITYTTAAFEKVSGYTKKELIGQPHSIIRHDDMPKEIFADMWNTIMQGKKWTGEVKNRKKNGGYYWVHVMINPIYNKENNIVGYSAIRDDITAQKDVEKLHIELNEYKNDLEDKVAIATDEIKELNIEIEETQKEVLYTMGEIGETRSKETGSHVKRVAGYAEVFAKYYGLTKEEIKLLKQASPLHDIGKVAISDNILNKPAKLTDEEFEIMKEHAQIGNELFKSSKKELLQTAALIAHEHHEKYNGTGYPRGLKGEDIHIFGRIIAIADVFDALGSHRVYKEAWEDEKIFKLIKDEKGKHFDPKLVDIFFKYKEEFLTIRREFSDKLKSNIISP